MYFMSQNKMCKYLKPVVIADLSSVCITHKKHSKNPSTLRRGNQKCKDANQFLCCQTQQLHTATALY